MKLIELFTMNWMGLSMWYLAGATMITEVGNEND